MSICHRYRRSNLFLVRIWAEESISAAIDGRGTGTEVEWRGRVQRVVDGEAHEFDSLQALADTMLAMLSPAEGTETETQVNRKKE